MKRIAALIVFAALAASAQNVLDPSWVSTTTSGTISTAGTGVDCSIAASCVWIVLPPPSLTYPAVQVAISGTWSGTLNFESAPDGRTWSAVATTTGATSAQTNGIYNIQIPTLQYVRVRASVLASGRASVTIAGLTYVPTITGGGSSGTGTVAWGAITGTLSNQADLSAALGALQPTLSLTTAGAGPATLISNVLNIPNNAITLTTLNTSGPATLSNNVLNIPNYQTGGGGGSGSGATYVSSQPSGSCATGTGYEIWSSDPAGASTWGCPAGTWIKVPVLPSLATSGNHICVTSASGVDTVNGCDTLVRMVTTTSDSVTAPDAVGVVGYNSASAVSVTVAAPGTSVPATTSFQFVNYGAGTVTLTPTSANFQPSGAATFQMAGGSATNPVYLAIWTDGTNYYVKNYTVSSGGAGGMTNPMTTAGDIIVGGTSGTPTRLAAGTSGYVLTSNGPGVAPSYQAVSAGTTTSAAPPYLAIGSNYYLPFDGMMLATRPNGLTGWTLAAGTTQTATITNQTNQSTTVNNDTGTVAWYYAPTPNTSSLEVSAAWNNTPGHDTSSGGGGVYLYDSTNSKIYYFKVTNDTGDGGMTLAFQTWTYNGVSAPSFSTNGTAAMSPSGGGVHLRISVSGTTATFSYTTDGGISWITHATQTVGTVGNVGVAVQWGTFNIFSVTHS